MKYFVISGVTLCLILLLILKPRLQDSIEPTHTESSTYSSTTRSPIPQTTDLLMKSHQRLEAPEDHEAQKAATPVISPRYTQIPKDQVVEFKVIDGLAVSYGDTVLGKPGVGFDHTQGLAEIRRPQIWKSAQIPFLIDSTVKNPERIQKAIQLFHARSNIRFIPHTQEEDAIIFTVGKTNCMSYLGRIGGIQPIYLEERCGSFEIAHEIMHALGFIHEQSRIDRDQFVLVLWENIQEAFRSQFAIAPEELMEVYADSTFDPTSAMMYDPHVFAIHESVKTMQLKSGQEIQRSVLGLSDADVLRLNRLYR
jgi:hypothetical protein